MAVDEVWAVRHVFPAVAAEAASLRSVLRLCRTDARAVADADVTQNPARPPVRGNDSGGDPVDTRAIAARVRPLVMVSDAIVQILVSASSMVRPAVQRNAS